MVEGLRRIQGNATSTTNTTTAIPVAEGEPDLDSPDIANAISHAQVLQLANALKSLSDTDRTVGTLTLEALLVGARVYVPPPPPKPEPSPDYKALMARLRREEEARAYERMINPPDAYDTSSFAQINRPVYAADTGDDGVTLSDVNRQVMLIFNFVVTMGGVAYALWMLARWWPTPSRLFLAMGGSIATGIVEYGLYAGYVWHLSEAARRDAKLPKEIREVVNTWTVGPGGVQDGAGDGSSGDKSSTESSTEKDGGTETSILGVLGASGIDSGEARRRK
ncbi:hypothetical protein SCUCBS95973_006599 [Sporothrix curviconia]|uniref:Endoplasmic reticulum-based factor for assembly of V-ATPase-domain-containing protein n=1 Tax=Sporothrix curviconia TaxID=1260050 RepID=A0ABP0C6V0_9PEZI